MPQPRTITDRWLKTVRVNTLTDFPDDRIPGFGVRVAPVTRRRGTPGRRTFYFRPPSPSRRRPGKRSRVTLGHYPEMTVVDARRAARLQAARDVPTPEGAATVAVLADGYLGKLDGQGKPSAPEFRRIYERDVEPTFGRRLAADVSPREINDLLVGVLTRGDAICNRVRFLMSSIFQHGVDLGDINANPVARTKRLGERRARTRVLSPDEIRRLWAEWDRMPYYGGLFKLMLISGQRPSVCVTARWDQMQEGWWLIPDKHRSKTTEHDVYLGMPLAQAALRPQLGNGSEWVFPNHRGEPHPYPTVQEAVKRFRKRADVYFFAYVLRHTAATGMGEIDVDDSTIGMILGHAPRTITRQVYVKARYRRRIRRAMTEWGKALELILDSDLSTWDAVADALLGEEAPHYLADPAAPATAAAPGTP